MSSFRSLVSGFLSSDPASDSRNQSPGAGTSAQAQVTRAVVAAPDAAAKKLFEMMSPVVVSTDVLDFGREFLYQSILVERSPS